jgi:hypothetical protein
VVDQVGVQNDEIGGCCVCWGPWERIAVKSGWPRKEELGYRCVRGMHICRAGLREECLAGRFGVFKETKLCMSLGAKEAQRHGPYARDNACHFMRQRLKCLCALFIRFDPSPWQLHDARRSSFSK